MLPGEACGHGLTVLRWAVWQESPPLSDTRTAAQPLAPEKNQRPEKRRLRKLKDDSRSLILKLHLPPRLTKPGLFLVLSQRLDVWAIQFCPGFLQPQVSKHLAQWWPVSPPGPSGRAPVPCRHRGSGRTARPSAIFWSTTKDDQERCLYLQ